MRKFQVIGFSILLPPLLATAQSQFDGTWKVDVKSAKPKAHAVFLLQDGMFHCKNCDPPFIINADGTDRFVVGDPDFDTMSMKVIDNYNVESTTKREGKVVRIERNSISTDGKTLDVSWTLAYGIGQGSGHFTYKRVAKGPAGANLLSGSWRMEKAELSGDTGTVIYKVNGSELTMMNDLGQSYTAKLDGSEASYKDDPEKATVSVRMLGNNTLEETTKLKGKSVIVSKMTVASDGKSMKIVCHDRRRGTKYSATAMKQ